MFNLLLVIQRTILIPLTMMTILTDWLARAKSVSDAGLILVDREVATWTEQSVQDVKAIEAVKSDLDEAAQQLAARKAQRKLKAKVDASSF